MTSPTLDPSLPGFPASPDSPGLPCDEKRVQMDISLRESRTANETEPLAISFGCLQTLSKQEKERITEIILLLNWGDLMADPFFNELPFLKKHLVQCNQNKQKEDKTSKKILTVEPRSPDFPGEPAAPTSPCKKKKKKLTRMNSKRMVFFFS